MKSRIVRESMAFLVRVLPLSSHFTEGEIFREDRLPVPPAALREIILNAVMHRDYSDPGSYVSVAIFDDRIEVASIGRLLSGLTIDGLSREHQSKLRNPLIAETFHRTGAVEIWGRGTNRVIDECRKFGIESPSFEERSGALVVTFRTAVAVTPQVAAILSAGLEAGSRDDLQRAAGIKDREHFRKAILGPLLKAGLVGSYDYRQASKPSATLSDYTGRPDDPEGLPRLGIFQ